MKILFVGRAKAQGLVSPILYVQGESLVKEGFEIDYFAINQVGLKSYLKDILRLRKYIKVTNPDIVHAHYSFTGIAASLATSKPIVVSIMGSFPRKNWKYYLVQFFISFFWKATIVKSERTAKQLNRSDLHIVPNGVDLTRFSEFGKNSIREKLRLKADKKYVLFGADPKRKVKNYSLASKAVALLKNDKVELLTVYNISHDQIALFMSASDVLLLTSISEGSPNVVKEAMACNLPIVSTDVGDVKWLLKDVNGAFVAKSFDEKEICKLVFHALQFNGKTLGKEKLLSLKLDSENIAQRIISVYNSILHVFKN